MPDTPEHASTKPMQNVVVLGGGTAGLLAALTFKRKLPDLKVEVIHSPEIGVITVGEGSLFSLPIFLHGVLGIDPGVFHRQVRPTYKLGIQYLWGARERFHYAFSTQLDRHFHKLPKANGYYCKDDFDYADIASAMMAHGKAFAKQPNGAPIIPSDTGYHVENALFVRFLEATAEEAGVILTEDTLEQAITNEQGIASLELKSGRSATADLFIDCSGFRSELLGGALKEDYLSFEKSLFCDRAIVGGWQRDDEPLNAYTTAETMDAGWAWQIEHEEVVNRGYVFFSEFLSDDEAEKEFRKKNPKLGDTRVIKFKSGRYRRSWVGNVVALGNSAGFVEPLEATAIAVITNHVNLLVNTLRETDRYIEPSQADLYNRHCEAEWEEIRRFLAVHYKFNTRLDTPFWKACREDTDLAGAEAVVEQFRAVGPGQSWGSELLKSQFFGMEGYLVMLVGMAMKYSTRYQPSEADRRIWNEVRGSFAARAKAGMSQEEGLRFLRADGWQWRPEYYIDLATKHYGSGAANFAAG